MKKLSTFLCMVLCSIALQANVVSGTCGDNLTWSYDTDTKALTIEGTGDMYDYDYWSGEQPWSQVKSDILSVSLPDGLTRIGSSAFADCTSITSITIPNSVTSIGYAAYEDCYSLTSVTIPNSVTIIENSAFSYCSSLTSVILGDSVTNIGNYAFYYCSSLTSVTIPQSVTYIGEYAFSHCSQVVVEGTTPPTIQGGAFNSDASIYVPCFTVGMYLAAPVWQFLSIVDDDNYRINLSASKDGKANITSTDCDANTATIEAVADNLYQFSQWSDGNTDNPRTLTLTQDTTFQAEFEPTPSYTVTLHGNGLRGYYEYTSDDGRITYQSWFNDRSEVSVFVRGGLTVYFYEDDMSCGTWLGWSDGVTDNERTITITSDTVITSLFDVPTYHVEVRAEEGGSLDGEGMKVYSEDVPDCEGFGVIGYIYAIPDEGYSFTQWSDGSTDAYREVLITQDTTFIALFEEIKYYSVTLRGIDLYGYYQNADSWGDISDKWFDNRTEISFTIQSGLSVRVTEEGYCGTWLGWSDGVTDNERTITITSDTVITSLFDVPTYQVSISAAANGSLTLYDEPIDGIETTLTDCDSNGEWIDGLCAVPDEGYYFIGWSDGNTEKCRDFIITSDTTIVANFAEKQQVQVLVGVESACKNMGTVSGGGIFYQGDVVTITATPNSGYHFVEWSDGNSIANREMYLTSDTTLFATFAAGDMGGKCGENLYWTWEDGALTITGTGDMDLDTHPAWWQYPIDIKKVSFPETMTSITAYAFYGYCRYAVYQAPYSLKEVIVPANVSYIGYAAFAECPQLTKWQYNGTQLEVQYAEGYGYDVFNGDAAITFLQAPAELVEYRNNSWGNLDTLIVVSGEMGEVPSNVSHLDLRNATNTTLRLNGRENLKTLYLPNGSTDIADKALLGCKHLGGITIPANVTRIGESAFEDCRSMTSVTFAGNNVETIGDWAFYNCHSLRSLTLPEGVEEVGLAAFYGCTYLNELTIPSTMKKIADNGFAGCEKLGAMYVNALVPPTIEAKTFEDVDRATPVFVPRGTMELYQADQYWSEFFNMAEYDAPTGNLTPSANETNALRKVVRDGQVLILRGDKTYTILGEAL